MFHRPGLGESDIGAETRNTERVVNELVDLLTQLEITEKVILAGHSYGGLCVQHFVRLLPDRVAGIILVDSTSVDLEELDDLELPILDEVGSDEYWLEAYRVYSLMEPSE
ncbi:alpha/beta fold hydrolase [Niallia sp. JL1B1071]|uniref:alpha/beta fold hydrolase n=1 Tax=Niallia tiangongensis TaxID=3237105 RepID=UPI0037DC924D